MSEPARPANGSPATPVYDPRKISRVRLFRDMKSLWVWYEDLGVWRRFMIVELS